MTEEKKVNRGMYSVATVASGISIPCGIMSLVLSMASVLNRTTRPAAIAFFVVVITLAITGIVLKIMSRCAGKAVKRLVIPGMIFMILGVLLSAIWL